MNSVCLGKSIEANPLLLSMLTGSIARFLFYFNTAYILNSCYIHHEIN